MTGAVCEGNFAESKRKKKKGGNYGLVKSFVFKGTLAEGSTLPHSEGDGKGSGKTFPPMEA